MPLQTLDTDFATTGVKESLDTAKRSAYSSGKHIGASHFLLSLLEYNNGSLANIIEPMGVDYKKLRAKAKKIQDREPSLTPGQPQSHTGELSQAFDDMTTIMLEEKEHKAGIEIALAALAMGSGNVSKILKSDDITATRIMDAVHNVRTRQDQPSQSSTDIASLLQFGEDLTEKAKSGRIDPIIGRDEEIKRMMQILSRRTKNNPVITGDGGVGKALTDDTLVPVHNNERVLYKYHGDLVVGDYVYNRQGHPVEVTGVFPQGVCDVYRVHFPHGIYVDCNISHLWTYKNASGSGDDYVWRTDTLEDIIPQLRNKDIVVPHAYVPENYDAGRVGHDVDGVRIVRVEKLSQQQSMTCIMVDDEEHLYQVTKNHIVTHNTAIVEGLAMKIASGDCPEQLANKRVISLDLSKLSAGVQYQGEYEERLNNVIKEVKGSDGRIILFVDEIHMINDSRNQVDLANILKPPLARGELRMIGATTSSEYKTYIEPDAALARRFQVIKADEPTPAETLVILRGIKEKYETHHGVKIHDSALVSCVELSEKYISGRFLPDKAIDLMDESASILKMQIDSRPDHIEAIQKEVNMLESEARALEREEDEESVQRLKEVKTELGDKREKLDSEIAEWKNFKGQVENIRTVRSSISQLEQEFQAANQNGDYGRASELEYNIIPAEKERLKELESRAEKGGSRNIVHREVTPDVVADVVAAWTGIPASKMNQSEADKVLHMADELKEKVIGQPEAVEALSKAVKKSRAGVNDPKRPIGSFLFSGVSGSGKTEISKALAAYLYDDDNALITISMEEYGEESSVNKLIGSPAGYVGYSDAPALEAVRDRPSCVLLFDEMEKAHDKVIITLLSVLEEGHITLSNGKEVDFKNTVIIFTSNLGADGEETTHDKIMEAIKARLRPEFINRLDAVIPFNALSVEDLEKILDIQIKKLEKNTANRSLSFSITPHARHRIAEKERIPSLGARPIRRVVTGTISEKLADEIIRGNIVNGDSILIDIDDNDEIFFRVTDRDETLGAISQPVEPAILEAAELDEEEDLDLDNELDALLGSDDSDDDTDDTDDNKNKGNRSPFGNPVGDRPDTPDPSRSPSTGVDNDSSSNTHSRDDNPSDALRDNLDDDSLDDLLDTPSVVDNGRPQPQPTTDSLHGDDFDDFFKDDYDN